MTSRFILRSVVLITLAFASAALTGCSKDKKDEADAAADASTDASVADAAPDAAAAVDAATAPLTTATTAAVKPKAPPPDPPICQKARAAKSRNSPSFPALEKECKAAGGSI